MDGISALAHSGEVAIRKDQRLESIFRLGQRGLGAKAFSSKLASWVCAATTSMGASKPCCCWRRLLSSCCCPISDGFQLHLQIVVGVHQFPIGLLGLLHHLHHALAELFVGKGDGSSWRHRSHGDWCRSAGRATAAACIADSARSDIADSE